MDPGWQIGAMGTFGLTAVNGPLTVRGALGIARAGLGNTLALTGDTVDLDYATAALSVVDAADVPTGRIVINGRVITSISKAARADIVGKTPQEISLRLGIADVNRTTSLFRAQPRAQWGGRGPDPEQRPRRRDLSTPAWASRSWRPPPSCSRLRR